MFRRSGLHRTPRATARRSPRGGSTTPVRGREDDLLLQALVGLMGRQQHATPSSSSSPSMSVKAMCPDKCNYEMTQSGFREWCRSMSDWLSLGNVSGDRALISIRLNCDEKLRMAIDSSYSEVH